MEKLTGEHLAVPEVTQSEEGQRTKLRTVLGFANKVLGINQVNPLNTKHEVTVRKGLFDKTYVCFVISEVQQWSAQVECRVCPHQEHRFHLAPAGRSCSTFQGAYQASRGCRGRRRHSHQTRGDFATQVKKVI